MPLRTPTCASIGITINALASMRADSTLTLIHIHMLDAALIMAANTPGRYIAALLEGTVFK